MKNTHYYITESLPDELGRQKFIIQWHSDQLGYNRDQSGYFTQHFFGILQDHLDRAKEMGIDVEFTDQIVYNYI